MSSFSLSNSALSLSNCSDDKCDNLEWGLCNRNMEYRDWSMWFIQFTWTFDQCQSSSLLETHICKQWTNLSMACKRGSAFIQETMLYLVLNTSTACCGRFGRGSWSRVSTIPLSRSTITTSSNCMGMKYLGMWNGHLGVWNGLHLERQNWVFENVWLDYQGIVNRIPSNLKIGTVFPHIPAETLMSRKWMRGSPWCWYQGPPGTPSVAGGGLGHRDGASRMARCMSRNTMEWEVREAVSY